MHPYAIGTSDGVLHFKQTATGSLYTSSDETNHHHHHHHHQQAQPLGRRLASATAADVVLDLPVKALTTIMRDLGDSVVDILKLGECPSGSNSTSPLSSA